MFPEPQAKGCFGIPASPTDKCYSHIAKFRSVLNGLGGIYEQAHALLELTNDSR